MNTRFVLISMVAALSIGFAACNESSKSDDDKCTVNVCSEDGTKLIKCNADGTTTEEKCEDGCSDNECKNFQVPPDCGENCKEEPAEKCTADVCSEDGTKLIKCNADGTTTEEVCEDGCRDNECKQFQVPPTCDHCSEDGSKLIKCNDDGTTSEVSCDYGCADAACKPEPACVNVNCSDSEKCIQGICVPESDILGDKAEGADCDKAAFVSHCEDNFLISCMLDWKDMPKVKKVKCTGNVGVDAYDGNGCATYKDGVNLVAHCTLDAAEVCSEPSKTKEVCDDGFTIKFSCVQSTNVENIVIWKDNGTDCEEE